MSKQLVIIVPSRSRPQNVQAVYEAWKQTGPFCSKIVFALDDDDTHNYRPFIDDPNVFYEINPRLRMVGTLNLVASKYAKEYRAIGFMGDDHRPRTNYWDMQVYNILKAGGPNKIVYCNDLIQGERLPTAVFLRSEIINKLGYMVPPDLIHMYADNFWLDVGRELSSIVYLNDIIIEHCHHIVGKAEHDAQYDEVDQFTNPDREAYEMYKATRFNMDIWKLRDANS